MTEERRSYLADFWAAFAIHGLAFLVSGGIFAAVVRVVTLRVENLIPYASYFAFFAGAGGAFLGVLAVRLLVKRTTPTFSRLDFDFEVVEQEIVYQYRETSTIQYRKRKKLRARKNGLSAYQDKYHWTGDKPPASMTSGFPAHTIQNNGRRTVWNHYEIRFQKILKKGDTIDTEVVWELDDAAHRSAPFVSATIEEPTDSLKFEVVLPTSFGIAGVTCNVTPGMSAKKPLSSDFLQLSRTGSGVWSLKSPHPKLMHHYEIEWIWPDVRP